MSPLAALWQSRKFRVLVLDTIISIVMFAAAHLGTQQTVETVTQLIAILQPVAFAVIVGIAHEDAAAKSAPKQVQAVTVEGHQGGEGP